MVVHRPISRFSTLLRTRERVDSSSVYNHTLHIISWFKYYIILCLAFYVLILYVLTFYVLTFYVLILRVLTFYVLTFNVLTFYVLTFYVLTFYILTFLLSLIFNYTEGKN